MTTSPPWPESVFSQWFAVARSCTLRARPLAVTVLDRPLMLARLPSGEILACEDRCPHRQAPLSHGRIGRLGVSCPYHGWTFGADGRCNAVPGLAPQACLPQVGVRPLPVLEHDGLVWLRPGPETPAADHPPVADSHLLPAPVAALPAGSRRFLWQSRWQAHVLDAIENFLDPLHTHTVHPGLVRKDGERAPVRARLSNTPHGFTVEYLDQPVQSGLLYRLFESPRTGESAHFGGAGTAQIDYRYANGSQLWITLNFTPESATQTHVFATLHVAGRWAPAWAVQLLAWPLLKRVARQDQAVLALQSDNLQRFPGRRHCSTELDLVRGHLEALWLPQAVQPSRPAEREITLYL
ncbi:Rieske 2Fe-2S domain-containing protein [Cupriavidus basilensis OR16]|uniref:Rieske 2Fe-2S domain-containing protein n=1 Tax=Cupriavidus basilensis OR16 TaxID=1127483 RepID=H1SAA4_9BURK|nr:aromatic ring-hydroxylating dioxygenase subunit alpha [Cupriavidus basilensis]EHP40524.1 Rieske 2Fe-2S domain-containing protein [Cupriavidus basilensis OR16]